MKLALAGIALGLLAACASRNSIRPEHIAAVEYFQLPRTVAVAPVRLVHDLAVPEEHLVRIDAEIAEALERADMTVVPAEIYADTWREVVYESDGLYDPFTGERNEEQFAVIRERFVERLVTPHGVTAILYPEIELVTAEYRGGIASWDGVARGIPGKDSGFFDFLDKLLDYDGVERGAVAALTLTVVIETIDGEGLFDHRIGIEVADRLESGEWVHRDDLLADDQLTRRAVRLVLDPLLSTRRS